MFPWNQSGENFVTSHKNYHLDHGQILAALQGAQVGQIMVTVVCENIGQQISNMSNFFS